MAELYNMAGHLIRRLNQISVAVFTDHMAAAGIDLTQVQFAALSAIASRPGMTQAELAGAIAYDVTTLGGVVDRLASKGHIRRDISPRDRRARVLFVTPDGDHLLARARPVVRALQDDILGGLDAEERAQLLGLLRKTTDAGNSKSRAPLRTP
ncbi:MarR family winged helix-turn-helix transcriptional regulator [Shimia sp. W99]